MTTARVSRRLMTRTNVRGACVDGVSARGSAPRAWRKRPHARCRARAPPHGATHERRARLDGRDPDSPRESGPKRPSMTRRSLFLHSGPVRMVGRSFLTSKPSSLSSRRARLVAVSRLLLATTRYRVCIHIHLFPGLLGRFAPHAGLAAAASLFSFMRLAPASRSACFPARLRSSSITRACLLCNPATRGAPRPGTFL